MNNSQNNTNMLLNESLDHGHRGGPNYIPNQSSNQYMVRNSNQYLGGYT